MDSRLDALLERAQTYSAFADHQRHLCTSAALEEVVTAARRAIAAGAAAAVTVFDDLTGARTEVEPTGDAEGVRSRLDSGTSPEKRPGPGRPKLGVVSREVSLLPRHWDWLATQPGGASAALRRLVEEARKRQRAQDALRRSREAAARAMGVLGGDLPNYEEALRALYTDRFDRLSELLAPWPPDLATHVRRLVETVAALQPLAAQEAAAHGTPAGETSHGPA